MTSTRTLLRNTILEAFEAARDAEGCGVREFDISLQWLHPQETTMRSTYCVIATDEQCTTQTMQYDNYDLTLVQVLYAHDTKDPRAKLDAMIEDAIRITRVAASRLTGMAWRQKPDAITTDDATTAAKDWAQAVLRWTVSHRREVSVIT